MEYVYVHDASVVPKLSPIRRSSRLADRAAKASHDHAAVYPGRRRSSCRDIAWPGLERRAGHAVRCPRRRAGMSRRRGGSAYREWFISPSPSPCESPSPPARVFRRTPPRRGPTLDPERRRDRRNRPAYGHGRYLPASDAASPRLSL